MATRGGLLSDDELARLALSADPDAIVAGDAVPVWAVIGEDGESSGDSPMLPEWYMPSTTMGPRLLAGWQRRVAVVLIVAFIAVDALGLCNTYGWLTWA